MAMAATGYLGYTYTFIFGRFGGLQTDMTLKTRIALALILLALAGALVAAFLLSGGAETPQLKEVKAFRQDIRVMVSTNGVIEPTDRSDIYAPLDGFVTSIMKREGDELRQGDILIRLNSEQTRNALSQARAALLGARRQERVVAGGPSKEEVAEVESSISETRLQLEQIEKDLRVEESLLAKEATTRMAVENVRKERDRLRLRAESLDRKRRDLATRYSSDDKEWERGRVRELANEATSLETQLKGEIVAATETGVVYSLAVKEGAYVTRGQLLAQVYRPGKIRLRAYVDEPDLGRIRKGQQVLIEWDGMPEKQWDGTVESTAEQVVALNNRSVGHVLCSINGAPQGLMPNLNVTVDIITDKKPGALMLPRSAVINRDGKPSVLIPQAGALVARPVQLGLRTPEEVEILDGVRQGESVLLTPGDVPSK